MHCLLYAGTLVLSRRDHRQLKTNGCSCVDVSGSNESSLAAGDFAKMKDPASF